MLIYGCDTENDEDIMVDENTTKFCAGFFGFFPHSSLDSLDTFLIEDLKLKYEKNLDFIVGDSVMTDVYKMCDRRTVDVTYIIGTVFDSAKEAQDYINSAISSSDNVAMNLFSDVDIYDGDKFTKMNRDRLEEENAEKNFKIEIEYEIKDKLNELFIHYQAQPIAMEILKGLKEDLESRLGNLK